MSMELWIFIGVGGGGGVHRLKIAIVNVFLKLFLTTSMAISLGIQKDGKHSAFVFSFLPTKVVLKVESSVD